MGFGPFELGLKEKSLVERDREEGGATSFVAIEVKPYLCTCFFEWRGRDSLIFYIIWTNLPF